jgi:hypothetical protein
MLPALIRSRTHAITRLLGLTVLAAVAARAVAQCPGDCNQDGAVLIDELVTGIRLARGDAAARACDPLDADRSESITVDELVRAVAACLTGCPPTPAPTEPPTATPVPTPTATPRNDPPVLPTPFIYRTHPEFPVHLAVGATDPEGTALRYAAAVLPAGATLDASGIVDWTPAADQLGPFYVPYAVTDTGVPPATAEGQLTFQVTPLDACTDAQCDPARGCTDGLRPLDTPCCATGPVARVAEPDAGCPEGLVLFVGRNRAVNTFGRMQNCDLLRIARFGVQSGSGITIHVQTRCVPTDRPVTVYPHLVTADRVVIPGTERRTLFLDLGADGYARKFDLRYAATGLLTGLEGQEADLTVTITTQGSEQEPPVLLVERTLRVVLTLEPVADLPD